MLEGRRAVRRLGFLRLSRRNLLVAARELLREPWRRVLVPGPSAVPEGRRDVPGHDWRGGGRGSRGGGRSRRGRRRRRRRGSWARRRLGRSRSVMRRGSGRRRRRLHADRRERKHRGAGGGRNSVRRRRVMLRPRDRRSLHDAATGAWPERDSQRIQRRREQPRNERAARDRDREKNCCDYPLLPAHVFPPPADNIPGGSIGRKVVSLDIKGV
jgi:hypothetical protein